MVVEQTAELRQLKTLLLSLVFATRPQLHKWVHHVEQIHKPPKAVLKHGTYFVLLTLE